MSEDLLTAMNELEERFSEWARRRKDVRAAIVVGSRARTDHPADEWADLDAAILTTAAPKYHRRTRWISEIADVWAVSKDASGVTYHILFAGGLDAGIAVIPARQVKLVTRIVPMLRRMPVSLGLNRRLERELQDAAAYTSRGFRILFDKDGIAERFFSLFPVPAAEASPQPTSAEFEATINDFWFNAIWTAKHIWRGELWRARSVGLEGSMRNALLKMIEWHARAASDGPLDTWEGGRFIEEWAGAEVLSELRHSLAGYDPAESQRALDSMMRLFARLSAESAGILGYDHQPDPGRRVIAWIDQFRPG